MELPPNTEPILSFSGEGLVAVLAWMRSENAEQEAQAAWEKIAKDVAHFSENSPPLDFDEIAQDLLTLEVLIYPIVMKNAPQALDPAESKRIQEQIQGTVKQLKSLQETLQQLHKEGSDLAKQLLPFFEKLKTIHQEMRAQWAAYRADWERFQAPDSPEEGLPPEKDATPPSFNQTQWQALRLGFSLLMAEVDFRKNPPNLTESAPTAESPLLPLLVQELRTLHARTQGFELLEKVQLTQKRTRQLAQALQSLHGSEPILPRQEKSAPSRDSSAKAPAGAWAGLKNPKKWGLWTLGAGGLLCFILLSQLPGGKQQETSQAKNSAPTLIRTQNASFFAEPSQKMKKPLGDLQRMVQSKGLKIPIYAPNETMKKFLESQEMPKETLRKITEEAQALTVIFVEGERAYLVSGEGVLQFGSLEKLKRFFDEVAQQYEQLVQVAEVLQEEFAQYEISVLLPEPNGEQGYGLALRDENQQVVGELRLGQNLFTLQWDAAGDGLSQIPPIQNVQDLVKALQALGVAP